MKFESKNSNPLLLSAAKEVWNFLLEKEFLKRLQLTFLIILVFRLISFVPLPGLNLSALTNEALYSSFAGSFLGFLNRTSGGALERMTVMALGISPYITASLFFSFAHHFIPYFAALKKEGAIGRQKINDYTKVAAFFMALVQGFSFSLYIERAFSQYNVVMFPGVFFHVQSAILMATATMIVVWFADQISLRGIGSGSSFIIYANIVSGIPSFVALLFNSYHTGNISLIRTLLFVLLSIFLLFLVTFCERAYKTIQAQNLTYRMKNLLSMPDSLVYIKLNPAGIYPSMFAGSFMALPYMLDSVFKLSKYELGAWILASLNSGSYGYVILHALMIFFTSYVYAELVFNPEESAKKFRNDSIIAGKVPGKSTQAFLEEKLFYVATLGGTYLAIVCCLPELFITQSNQMLFISGTSYIIVVGVAVDLIDKISAGVYARFIEKSMKSIRKGYF